MFIGRATSAHLVTHRAHDWELLSDCCVPILWLENQRSISSCIVHLGQVNLVMPIPVQIKPDHMSFNLKAHLGPKHVANNSIRYSYSLVIPFSLRGPLPINTMPSLHCMHS